ncbi:MAG: PEP-CTERM sorting domain-containing protein [Phormidium sp. BM_Day4_Bin.17]|nr:PEP-CTERM sorting domain-containing protein [Phormidium sp. BM_Day4_Bin.17]UCJ12861.1 MAG: PEP-CTERM sorting domain-containing protein [Phormidium sp. PBR-2020]
MKLLNPVTTTLCGVAVATVASFSVGVQSANALFHISGTTCSTDNLTGSTDCEGIFGADPPEFVGNPSADIDSSTELFGKTGWTKLFKVDMDSISMTDGLLNVTGNDGDLLSGSWNLTGFDFSNYGDVMFTLKGGPTFSAYLSDGVTTNGTWTTQDLRTGGQNPRIGPGLSNFVVWGREPVPTVPEPATIFGLGAIALASRFLRRKSDDV